MTVLKKNTFNYIAIVAAVQQGRLLIDQAEIWFDLSAPVNTSLFNSARNINTFLDESVTTCPIDPHFFDSVCQSPTLIPDNIRICLETTWHLLEAGGITRESLQNNNAIRIGIYLSPAQKFTMDTHTDNHLTNDNDYQLQGQEIINHITCFLDLPPSQIITDTESFVSINASHSAYQSLLEVNCQLAIVMGVSLTSKTTVDNEEAQEFKNTHRFWAVLLKKQPQAINDKDNVLAIIQASQDDENKANISTLEISPPPISTTHSEYTSQKSSPKLIVLSANSSHALLLIASQLLEHISISATSSNNCSLADFAYTLQSCREAMNYRLAMVVNNFENLSLGLAQYILNEGHATAEAQQILKLAQPTTPIPLHRGDIKSNAQLQSLLSGSSGESMVKALLLEKNFNNLALYWTQGGVIPWKSLYEDESPRKVNLPGYPFYQPPQKQVTAETDALCLNTELEKQALRHMTTESIEIILLNIWKELLGTTQIGRQQNFFEIGGDSQLGMHMMSLLRDAIDVDLPLNYLYTEPTVAKMSEKIIFMMALSSAPSVTDDISAYQEYEEGIIL